MSRNKSIHVCQSCGVTSTKWSGRCEACGDWNTVIEEAVPTSAPGGLSKSGSRRKGGIALHPISGMLDETARTAAGVAEFDRVCGGGLVPGSAILIGGDPGIGKSTILLQLAARVSERISCIYVTGEEAIDQIRLRGMRLGVYETAVQLAASTNVRDILATLNSWSGPGLVIIDSIQTMFVDNLDSAPGTVSQVRASAQELIRCAKQRGFTLVLVGHVTKEGMIAGPKVLEHMVDTVLYLEGDRGHQFRILRSVKNRYGPTDEIGVFEMTETGLREVANPSALFLADRQAAAPGAAVFAGVEGTRPVLVEIQALVAQSALGTPRRAVVGWDGGRLSMLLAVLEARCGVSMAGRDVYLNVAGGLRIAEPAADLAVAAALLSALSDRPVPADTVLFGEIGLSGEIRSVGRSDVRLKEAAKLGFNAAVTPKSRSAIVAGGLRSQELAHLAELVVMFQDDAAARAA